MLEQGRRRVLFEQPESEASLGPLPWITLYQTILHPLQYKSTK